MGTEQDEPPSSSNNVVQWFQAMDRKERLTVVISMAIITMVVITSIVVLTGENQERFTEFYVLNSEGKAYDYPQRITAGNETSLIIGVVNHEGRTVPYTVEAWLVNYTLIDMALNVTQMYYVDRYEIELESTAYEMGGPWVPQYERTTQLDLTTPGNFYLFLMLFTEEVQPNPDPQPYDPTYNYALTEASWRIVMCVNDDITYLRLAIEVI